MGCAAGPPAGQRHPPQPALGKKTVTNERQRPQRPSSASLNLLAPSFQGGREVSHPLSQKEAPPPIHLSLWEATGERLAGRGHHHLPQSGSRSALAEPDKRRGPPREKAGRLIAGFQMPPPSVLSFWGGQRNGEPGTHPAHPEQELRSLGRTLQGGDPPPKKTSVGQRLEGGLLLFPGTWTPFVFRERSSSEKGGIFAPPDSARGTGERRGGSPPFLTRTRIVPS